MKTDFSDDMCISRVSELVRVAEGLQKTERDNGLALYWQGYEPRILKKAHCALSSASARLTEGSS